jgi:succinoglycan biosynthesis transport protein ExoP
MSDVSTSEQPSNHLTTLSDYVDVLRRRKWIVLQALILVPLAAALISMQQQPLYSASADVLLSRQSFASTLTDTPDPISFQDAQRFSQTQADIARSPELLERVARAVGSRSAADIRGSSSVDPKGDADLLVFTVTDTDPEVAKTAATAYARQFTLFRRELDTNNLRRARLELRQRIDELESQGVDRQSDLYGRLVENEQELRTLEALQISNTSVNRVAEGAAQIQPRTRRTVILSFLVALVLGLALAFVWEALDKRVRTSEEIQRRLRIPLLGRLPAPPRRVRRQSHLVMLTEPDGPNAEAIRTLRTNIEFLMLTSELRSIMITSASQQEGKSTTVANLAVAFARAGKRTILVDLDLRRPFVEKFFGLEGRFGVSEVLGGSVSLEDALTVIPLPVREGSLRGSANGNGAIGATAFLEVLPCGAVPPPNPGELMNTPRLDEVIASLEARADIVFVDAPPMLAVGDALALTRLVDGLLVVSHERLLQRPALIELARVLSSVPSRVLGFVATGVSTSDVYGYGGYGSYAPRQRQIRAQRSSPVSTETPQ